MELNRLRSKDFGDELKPRRGEIRKNYYIKPHPSSLAEDDPLLAALPISLDFYTAKFNDFSKMNASDKRVALKYHPAAELLQDVLSQDSLSSGSDISYTQNLPIRGNNITICTTIVVIII